MDSAIVVILYKVGLRRGQPPAPPLSRHPRWYSNFLLGRHNAPCIPSFRFPSPRVVLTNQTLAWLYHNSPHLKRNEFLRGSTTVIFQTSLRKKISRFSLHTLPFIWRIGVRSSIHQFWREHSSTLESSIFEGGIATIIFKREPSWRDRTENSNFTMMISESSTLRICNFSKGDPHSLSSGGGGTSSLPLHKLLSTSGGGAGSKFKLYLHNN